MEILREMYDMMQNEAGLWSSSASCCVDRCRRSRSGSGFSRASSVRASVSAGASTSTNASTSKTKTTHANTNRRLHIMTMRSYPLTLSLIAILAKSATFTNAAADNFFCGTSWADASSNCFNRQPCPSAADDECTATPGHICFADTTCSAAEGHGERFKYMALAGLAELDYGDASNKKFCGSWWAAAEQDCSVATHCPSGVCSGQNHCMDTACNVQDIVQQELGEDWKEMVVEILEGGGGGIGAKMDPDDVRRNQFCGLSWGQASTKCTQWCKADDSKGDCPRGQKCFADTTCYYDTDLQPSMSPISTFVPTRSPIYGNDPSNLSFCGGSWALAIQNCSPETNCKTDNNCEETHQCYPSLPGCDLRKMNIVPVNRPKGEDGEDLDRPRDWRDDPNDARNFRFCGDSWEDAAENCQIDRHCPQYTECSGGLSCFEHLSYVGADHCSAYAMVHGLTRAPSQKPTTEAPTDNPTYRPTPSPTKHPSVSPTTASPTEFQATKSPTDEPTIGRSLAPVIIISGLCASSYESLQQTYRTAPKCSNINLCHYSQMCFPGVDATSFDKPPSSSPTKSPISQPSSDPTKSPVSQPSSDPTGRPVSQPSSSPTRRSISQLSSSPTRRPVSAKPTISPTSSTYAPSSTFPTYWFTYGPSMGNGNQQQTDQKPAAVEALHPSQNASPRPTNIEGAQMHVGQKPAAVEALHPSQNESLRPTNAGALMIVGALTPSLDTRQPTPATIAQNPAPQRITFNPTTERDASALEEYTAKEKHFFCATTVSELRQSCDTALVCDFSVPCPPGQGCIQYDDCQQKETQQNPSDKEEEQIQQQKPPNPGAKFNLYPDLCPEGFEGFNAVIGNCQQYYECRNTYLESSNTCETGFLFDNDIGECVSEELVNSDCTRIIQEESQQKSPDLEQEQLQQNSPNSDTLSTDLCPVGFVGLNAVVGNCNRYYECKNGYIEALHTCEMGFLFANGGTECVSQEMVNSKCEIVDQEQMQQEPGSDGEPWNYFPDLCPEGFVGVNALAGDCQQYYDCKNGYVEAAKVCGVTFLFDNGSGECISQQLVNSKCERVEQEQMQQESPNSGVELSNYFPDLCPEGFVGMHAYPGDCRKYNDCKDGFLEASHTCELGFMFENSRKLCISQKLVNSKCEIVLSGGNKDQDESMKPGGGKNEMEQTDDKQNMEQGGSSDNSHPYSVPENEEPPDCPIGFDGLHTKDDCTKYFECADGNVGLVHLCTTSYKFDKVRGRCISGDLVSPYCYGPALDEEEEVNQQLDGDGVPRPSPSPADLGTSVGKPMSSSDDDAGTNNGAGASAWSYTLVPTTSKSDSERGHWTLWVRERDEDNGEKDPTQKKTSLCMLALLTIFFVL